MELNYQIMPERVFIKVTRSPKKSINYCKKEGDFYRFGEFSIPGKRNDLDEFKNGAKFGIYDLKSLREKHSCVLELYPCFVSEYILDCLPLVPFVMHVLKEWQQTIDTSISAS